MNINFAFKVSQKLAIFGYGKFEFEAVSDKWLHETDEEEEECTKPRKQAPTKQQSSRKDASASAKAARMVHCFWRKCSAVFDLERL